LLTRHLPACPPIFPFNQHKNPGTHTGNIPSRVKYVLLFIGSKYTAKNLKQKIACEALLFSTPFHPVNSVLCL